MGKILLTAVSIVVTIVASAGLFIGANKLFDVAPRRWRWFMALIGGITGFAVFGTLWGNRLITEPVVNTVIGTAIGAAVGYLLGVVGDRRIRLVIGAAGGLAMGLIVGFASQGNFLVLPDGTPVAIPMRPALQTVPLVVWPLVGAVLGAAWWVVRGRSGLVWRPMVFFASLGWLVAAFLIPQLDRGPKSEVMVAAGVLGLGFGVWAGLGTLPDSIKKDRVQESARKYIFLVPALAFIIMTLVVPTLRTIYLAFRDRRGENYVGFDNFAKLFTDPNTIDLSGWTTIFSSRLFYLGAALIVLGLIGAAVAGRRVGGAMEATPTNIIAASIGVLFLSFAAFTALRGTIINNLWWVVTVTALATALGLAIAVLADRARYESFAKSLIFMPMAISFVGAGIIWRFMFIARPVQNSQTGLLNALWVGLGRWSRSNSATVIIVMAVVALIAAFFGYVAYRGYRAKTLGVTFGSSLMVLFLIWFVYSLAVGIGGVGSLNGQDVAQTILFVQESPFNNVWLMVVLIWIQTGFTMVIFSAAIKAVPSDLIEASKVDGATESQTFWSVTIPQILPTIGVVTTTLIVLVMKVFDIVKVMTNGNFDTQVIANEMWQRAFTELNFGLGSALALILFIAVLPVFYINVRRMQEAAG